MRSYTLFLNTLFVINAFCKSFSYFIQAITDCLGGLNSPRDRSVGHIDAEPIENDVSNYIVKRSELRNFGKGNYSGTTNGLYTEVTGHNNGTQTVCQGPNKAEATCELQKEGTPVETDPKAQSKSSDTASSMSQSRVSTVALLVFCQLTVMWVSI
jgi:hypothetical protein